MNIEIMNRDARCKCRLYTDGVCYDGARVILHYRVRYGHRVAWFQADCRLVRKEDTRARGCSYHRS